MKKLGYSISTLSRLIVSPRSDMVFYQGLEFDQEDIKRSQPLDQQTIDKLTMIYPFYQYGDYTKYAPASAEYYLPGSSVKGALCQNPTDPGSFFVDDAPIENNNITLQNLYKVQYLNNSVTEPDGPSKPMFEAFFKNIGVEMVEANAELKGELYAEDKDTAQSFLSKSNGVTKQKIHQTLDYLKYFIDKDIHCEKYPKLLNEISNNLNQLLSRNDVLLLGGYKGLLHSLELDHPLPFLNSDTSQDFRSALYIDPCRRLPYGLVRMEICS